MTDPQEPIDAEIVPPVVDPLEAELGLVPSAPRAIVKRTYRKSGKMKKGRSRMMVVVDSDGRHEFGMISERERKFIGVYVKSGNVTQAANEIGITPQTGYNYLARPAIQRYVQHLRERAARAADLTMDKVAGVIGDAVDGITTVTPLMLQAASVATKFLRPSGTNLTINQQINNHGTASPFAGLDQSGMLDALKRNMLEMDADSDERGTPVGE